MDKEVLAVIGQLYLENLALRNMLEEAKNQIVSNGSVSKDFSQQK